MVSDYERRLRRLESTLGPLLARVAALEAQVGFLTQQATQFRNGGGGGGGYSNIKWVLTPSGGIPYATSTTVGTVVTNTPGSVNCFDSTEDATTKAWSTDTSVAAALLVYNDWTSATSHTNAGVGGQWICVGTAADGTVRCLGDPCP